MDLLFDVEADGLNPTKFWCISAIDIHTKETYHFGPDSIDHGFMLLNKADTLIGHNIICYDLWFMRKLYSMDLYHKNIVDTLILSRMFNPDRDGGHSLEAWGRRLGRSKVVHEDWSQYTPEMEVRCTEDVKLNLLVYNSLKESDKYFSKDSIDLEYQIAYAIQHQQDFGWYFDIPKAERLLARVNDRLGILEDRVRKTFLPKQNFVKVVTPKIKQDGELSRSGLRPDEYDRLIESGNWGPFERYDTQEFNLGSRQQIARWLQEDFGWVPTDYTDNGQPKVTETSLESVDIPEAKMIYRYLMFQKIRSFLNNWLSTVSEDSRQHGYVNTIGAITRRMTHSEPNLAQVPSSRKPYGKQCRELFTVPEGYKLVGVDAEGLEMRMLAHYMDNPDYTKAVVEGDSKLGTDAHTMNMKAAGLTDRDQAKTMFYALIYGAGYKKLGSIVGGGIAEGRHLKHKWFEEMPDLGELIHKVQSAAERGFIKSFDGSILRVRTPNAALNVLLQGGGEIIMKRANVILYNQSYYFRARQVGVIHDEMQWEVPVDYADEFARVAEESIKLAGEYYNLKCPMSGSASIGTTWAETH